MNIKELYKHLSDMIPSELSCDWDNDGLMVEGDTEREIKRVLVSLDATEGAIEYAVENGFDAVITHHPLIFRPLRSLTTDSAVGRCVLTCVRAGVSLMSFHTRLDAVEGGVNDALAAVLGLQDVTPLPEVGRVGVLKESMSIDDFVMFVRDALGCDAVNFVGDGRVSRVAVVGGDGKDNYRDAAASGADTYLTGSMSYNMMVDAASDGVNVVEAGHFHTEQPVCSVLAGTLAELGIESEVFYSNPVGICLLDNFVD